MQPGQTGQGTMDAAGRYARDVHEMLQLVRERGAETIARAAVLMADAIQAGKLIYAFGSGHSQSVAIEFYYRAGGLACCDVVEERTFGRAERLPGYAALLLDRYPVSPGDVLFVISNSGRNALPVEMAEAGRQRGMKVVGITSLAHSRSVAARVPGGKRLFEVCDEVIDTCVPSGDAMVDLGQGIRVGGASTLSGVFIAQALVCLAAEELVRRGVRPPVFTSMNLDQGDAANRPLLEAIRRRVRGL